MIKVTLSRDVRIENPPAEIAHKLIERYTIPNPDFYKLERLGKWTGGTPETLALWQRDGQTLVLPYGTLSDVLNTLGRHACIFESQTSRGDSQHDYHSNINLYDYQENAVISAVAARRGILVAPCGSGKTQMGLEIAARLGMKTLWITHTYDLLNQSLGRAKSCFDLPPSAFGVIAAGKVEIGSVLTFATVQTMAKLDLSQYRDVWGCVVVDECHHVAGTPTKLMQFARVVSSLNAVSKFGLTATPKRADGMVRCMYAYLGPKLYEVSSDDVADKTCPVEYMMLKTGWDCSPAEITNPDGTLNYTGLINKVCNDPDRNRQIALTIKAIHDLDSTRILVLSERISHLEALWRILNEQGISNCRIITGKSEKRTRYEAIDDMKSGKCRLILATYQLAKEGLDIPELTHLVLASPNKTDTTIQQACGRVARISEGKKRGIVVDFSDQCLPLEVWAKRRKRIYKRLEYKERYSQG